VKGEEKRCDEGGDKIRPIFLKRKMIEYKKM